MKFATCLFVFAVAMYTFLSHASAELADTDRPRNERNDALWRVLQIDEKKVAASAKVTQQDAALVSRVCTLFGLSDQQRTAIANLARKRKLGLVNFDTIERIEKYMRSPRKEQDKRAFDEH